MSRAHEGATAARAAQSCACPLCGALAEAFLTVEGRNYFRCPTCEARFLDPAQRPSAAQEHAHYLHHENDPDDPRYRRFLSKLADPLLERLSPASNGLDYGCGPGPALVAMLREAGHQVAGYDPFFAPDPSPLAGSYDFVTCTEVAEHFHHPAREFERLRALVRPGGWLAVMTCFQTDDARFRDWHYRKDPTHVVFYRAKTFHHLADGWGWSCACPVKDVVLMRRPPEMPAHGDDHDAERRFEPASGRAAAPDTSSGEPLRMGPRKISQGERPESQSSATASQYPQKDETLPT